MVSGQPTSAPPHAHESCVRAPARGPANAASVAISRDGRNVYVAAYGSDGVATFDRNTRTKALVQKPGPAGCTSKTGVDGCAIARSLDGPESVTVSRDGANVYVASGGGNAVTAFDRDPDDGTLTLKAGKRGCVSIDGTDGACATASGLDIADGPSSVAVSPDGANVYASSANRGIVLVLDRDKRGALTVRPGADGCVSGDGSGGRCASARSLDDGWSVAVSSDGRSVYVTSLRRGAVMAFDRDERTGTLRLVSGPGGCISKDGTNGRCATARTLAGATNVALSPDGRSVYVSSYDGDAVTVFDRK